MDTGQIIFVAFLAVVGVFLYFRRAKKTVIHEGGHPAMRIEAAKEAARLAEQAKKDARGGS